MYTCISKKADLLRTLRESGSQKDIADPIATWQTAPTRSLQMAESEDNLDAVEHFKASESVAATSNLNEKDSLWGSSKGFVDTLGSSEDPGDEKGAADNTTAAPNKAHGCSD